MNFGAMNYLAIPAAAVAGWLVGAVWYMALARPWMAAQGWGSKEEMPKRQGLAAAAPFLISFLALLVMAFVLAGAIGHLGPGQATMKNGVISGAILWAGFIATTVTVNYAFAGKKAALTLIDAGHWLAVLLVQGFVLGALGA
ncbi:DUF1761 domain-containing protein [Afifella sp. IM 167]|uniref:DUF1761 domain-containing protein n=1 Tax=Afifella sp. IM 167 TaxID=2033586 RepID=UPI001CD03D2A|nr:DUF1761 domain-containing protein [Afifella sp. IM 167]MBZ8134940.1 hypothetical protein [Afifella sp. IM 167]